MLLIDDILETKDVAKMLKVHQRTVIRLVERGELRAFRVGDLWRFERKDVEGYIQAQKRKIEQKQDDA